MFLNVRWGQDLQDLARPPARLSATWRWCTRVVSPGHEALSTGGRRAPWSGAHCIGLLAAGIVALASREHGREPLATSVVGRRRRSSRRASVAGPPDEVAGHAPCPPRGPGAPPSKNLS